MADSPEFELAIGVTADLSKFDAQLGARLSEVEQRGISIPVRGGVAGPGTGGQGARVSQSVNAAEQEAVNRARERAEAQSGRMGGGGYYPILGGGGNIAPTIDRNKWTADLRAMRAEMEAFRREMERPIQVDIRAGGFGGGGIGGFGGGGSGAGRGGEAGVRAFRTGIIPRGRVSTAWNAETTGMAGLMRNDMFANAEAGLAGLEARAAVQASPATGAGMAALGVTAAALIGIQDIAQTRTIARQAASDANFATSPEQRALIRARAEHQAWDSSILSTPLRFLDWVDSPLSPARKEREAGEAVHRREAADEARGALAGLTSDRAYRDAYLSRGATAAGLARARSQADTTVAEKTRELTGMTVYQRYGPQGDAARTEIARARESTLLPNLQAAAADVAAEYASEGRIAVMRAAVLGATSYTVGLRSLTADSRARIKALRLGGEYEEANRQESELGWARSNYALSAIRQAQITRTADYGAANVSALLSQNRPYEARQEAIVNRFAAENQAIRANAKPEEVEGLIASSGVRQRAEMRAERSANARDIYRGGLSLGGAARQLGAAIAGDALGARIAGIETQRDVALAGTTDRDLRKLIGKNAQLESIYARQQDARQRLDTGDSLNSEIRQSQLRQRGGNESRVQAALEQIESETAIGARGFTRNRDFANASRRRQLGVEQAKELQSNYFRSIQFEEVSGDRLVRGQGNPFAGVRKKFQDAEDEIASGKREKDVSDETGTTGLLKSIKDILARIERKTGPARAGP